MHYVVLGPVSLSVAGMPYLLRRVQNRAVLGYLLLNAGHEVSLERLIEAVWGGAEPTSARNQVHVAISEIRNQLRALGLPPLLHTGTAGYLLSLADDGLDLLRFEHGIKQATSLRSSGRSAEAGDALRTALRLWDGPPLGGVSGAYVEPVRHSLTERRLIAVEMLLDIELELGSHQDLIAEYLPLLAAHPYRERMRRQFMTALYRAGRAVEALELARELRTLLDEEHGMAPGPELLALEGQILRRDPDLDLEPPTRVKASVVTPKQLPSDPRGFTGRENLQARLDKILAGADGLALVSGPSGVGKTALAVRWAHRVIEHFPDGQLYLDLRGHAGGPAVEPVEALARVLASLGVAADDVPVDLDHAAALFRTLVADLRLLLVLDNVRDARQIRPLLPGGPDCFVLATTQYDLRGLVAVDGAIQLAVPPLDAAEAEELLERLLGPERVAAERETAQELARVCAHLPLAVRLAASSLAGSPHRTIADYLRELADLKLSSDQQNAARVAFDLSYRALSERASWVLGLISMLPGRDIALETVAAVGDLTETEAYEFLMTLVDAHLLEVSADRYTCHELVRRFARWEAATEHSQELWTATLLRLYQYYLSGVEAATRYLSPSPVRLPTRPELYGLAGPRFEETIDAAAWLDRERPNLVAVIAHTSTNGPWSVAYTLADAMRNYFWTRVDSVERMAVARAAYAAATADGNLPAIASARIILAGVHQQQGQLRPAVEHLKNAAMLSRAAGWTAGEAAALTWLAITRSEEGRLRAAYRAAQAAVGLSSNNGAHLALRGNLATICLELGQLAEAEPIHRELVERFRSIGSRAGEAITLTNLGQDQHLLGKYDLAVTSLADAVHLQRQTGDQRGECEAVCALARLLAEIGEGDRAWAFAKAALMQAAQLERQYPALAYNTLGVVSGHARRYPIALDHHHAAARAARAARARPAYATALIGSAGSHLALGRPGAAHADAARAFEIAERAGTRILRGRASALLAAVDLDRGRVGEAVKHAMAAASDQRAAGHLAGLCEAAAVLARAHELDGDHSAAKTARREAEDGWAVLDATVRKARELAAGLKLSLTA